MVIHTVLHMAFTQRKETTVTIPLPAPTPIHVTILLDLLEVMPTLMQLTTLALAVHTEDRSMATPAQIEDPIRALTLALAPVTAEECIMVTQVHTGDPTHNLTLHHVTGDLTAGLTAAPDHITTVDHLPVDQLMAAPVPTAHPIRHLDTGARTADLTGRGPTTVDQTMGDLTVGQHPPFVHTLHLVTVDLLSAPTQVLLYAPTQHRVTWDPIATVAPFEEAQCQEGRPLTEVEADLVLVVALHRAANLVLEVNSIQEVQVGL